MRSFLIFVVNISLVIRVCLFNVWCFLKVCVSYLTI